MLHMIYYVIIPIYCHKYQCFFINLVKFKVARFIRTTLEVPMTIALLLLLIRPCLVHPQKLKKIKISHHIESYGTNMEH